jgi:hypothetical protein
VAAVLLLLLLLLLLVAGTRLTQSQEVEEEWQQRGRQ